MVGAHQAVPVEGDVERQLEEVIHAAEVGVIPGADLETVGVEVEGEDLEVVVVEIGAAVEEDIGVHEIKYSLHPLSRVVCLSKKSNS